MGYSKRNYGLTGGLGQSGSGWKYCSVVVVDMVTLFTWLLLWFDLGLIIAYR
jgi:hypothetical protein